MRFLADENCDFAAIHALREAGHDVALVRETCPGASDEAVANLARDERRVLLTEDKDFGQLVRALSSGEIGVILIRFPTHARSVLGAKLLEPDDPVYAWRERLLDLHGGLARGAKGYPV